MSNVAKHGVNRCTKQRGAGDKRMATRKARTDGEQDDGWPKRLDHAGALERIMQRSDGSLKGLDQDTARRSEERVVQPTSERFLRQLQGHWQRRRACGSARSAHVEPAWFGRSSCRLRCRGCLSIWQQDGIGEQLEGAAIEEHRR
jgi:hypothetical protein